CASQRKKSSDVKRAGSRTQGSWRTLWGRLRSWILNMPRRLPRLSKPTRTKNSRPPWLGVGLGRPKKQATRTR
ncbi:unnamed protein product, partial [Effrenium voratum]